MNYDFNILYYIDIYKKWWKRIALVMFVSMFLTMFISLRQPINYISTVTLLSTGGGQSSAGSLGKFLGLAGLSEASSSGAIIPLLNSRRMATDINEQFDLSKKPKFGYSMSTAEMQGAFAINVKGTDPVLTERIANFVVKNFDKINMELDITPNKPMVKVLDPAIRGRQIPRQRARKILVAGILSFLLMNLYIFSSDYLKKLKLKS